MEELFVRHFQRSEMDQASVVLRQMIARDRDEPAGEKLNKYGLPLLNIAFHTNHNQDIDQFIKDQVGDFTLQPKSPFFWAYLEFLSKTKQKGKLKKVLHDLISKCRPEEQKLKDSLSSILIEYVSFDEKDEDQCLRESQKIIDKQIQEDLVKKIEKRKENQAKLRINAEKDQKNQVNDASKLSAGDRNPPTRNSGRAQFWKKYRLIIVLALVFLASSGAVIIRTKLFRRIIPYLKLILRSLTGTTL